MSALATLLRDVQAEEREVLLELLGNASKAGLKVDKALVDLARDIYARGFENGHEKGWDDHSSQTPMDF